MRLIHGASPLLTVALLLGTAGQAGADPAPAPDGLGALIAAVAEANQRLDELGAQVQTQQESVNKSLVEVQTARDNAATAQTELAASQQSVRDCDGAIADAQSRFDDYAVQTYMNGPSDALLTASNPDEVIQALAADDAVANVSNRVMGDLKRTRTEQANRESRARLAKEKADAAAADAKTSQDNAVVALQTAQAKFGDQQGEINKLAAERDAARARLNEARAAARLSHPHIVTVLGGGFVNTELRELSDPRVFDFVDFVTLDANHPNLVGRAGAKAAWPWPVLLVNVVGSLIAGVAMHTDVALIAVTGFAGGLTTFSTFSVETVQLWAEGRWRAATASVALNVAVGLAAATAGWLIGLTLFPG